MNVTLMTRLNEDPGFGYDVDLFSYIIHTLLMIILEPILKQSKFSYDL